MFEFVEEDIYRDKFGIYQIKNLKTGCVYVGQTRQPFIKRFFYHRWQLRTNTHDNPYLQASYNKHGEDSFQLAEKYGISYSNINAIRSNRSWKYVEVDGWNEYCETHKNNVRARQSRSAN